MSSAIKIVMLVLCSSAIVGAQPNPSAQLIILNAKVRTVDKAAPIAEAVAVIGDRIVAVGLTRDIERWRGPQTVVVDANGKLLLPGFNDAHVHFVSGGTQLDSVQLNDATTPQEFARRIGERAKTTPKGEWVLLGNWDETKWNPPDLPTKELIDGVAPDTPVFVSRYDGHMGLANSEALRMAGITAHTPDPPGGAIVRDARLFLFDEPLSNRGHQRPAHVGRLRGHCRLPGTVATGRNDGSDLRRSFDYFRGGRSETWYRARVRRAFLAYRRLEGLRGWLSRVEYCLFLRALPPSGR